MYGHPTRFGDEAETFVLRGIRFEIAPVDRYRRALREQMPNEWLACEYRLRRLTDLAGFGRDPGENFPTVTAAINAAIYRADRFHYTRRRREELSVPERADAAHPLMLELKIGARVVARIEKLGGRWGSRRWRVGGPYFQGHDDGPEWSFLFRREVNAWRYASSLVDRAARYGRAVETVFHGESEKPTGSPNRGVIA